MITYEDLLARAAARSWERETQQGEGQPQGQPQGEGAPPMDTWRPEGAPETRQDGTPQQPAGERQQPCGTDTILMMAVIFAIMYFLLIRPANKQRKEHAAMIASLQKGDRVVTNGGIHGIVGNLNDKTVILKVDSIKMTVDRSAITRVERDEPSGQGSGS